MVKPEILKKQIALIKQTQAKEAEQKKLEAELAGLKRGRKVVAFEQKHKKKIAIIKGVGYVGKRIGIGFGRILKGTAKGLRESKGLKQTYENMYGPEPRRRFAVVKRRKKRKKQKEVREKYIIRGGKAYPLAIPKRRVVAVVKRKKRKR